MRVPTLLFAWVLLASPTGVRGQETPVLDGVVVGVVDGDTADVRLASGMIRVRLHAIDTPERGQPHFQAAKDGLSTLIYGKAVQLEPYEQDRYERLVARIWLGPLDVNAEMIKQGHAWTYRQYADEPQYCAYEKAARDLQRGLWKLPREQRPAPWEWRRRRALHGRMTDYANETVAQCIAALAK